MEPYQYVLLFFVACMIHALARVIIEIAAKEKRRREIAGLLDFSKTLNEPSECFVDFSRATCKAGDNIYAFSEACDSFIGVARESGEPGDLIQVRLPGYITIGEELIELKDGKCLRHGDSLKTKRNGRNLDS